MSKSQQNQTYSAAQGQVQQNNANETAAGSTLNGILGTSQGNANSLFPSITGNYSNLASTGGYDPSVQNTIEGTATNLATTGGLTPGNISAIKDEAAQSGASAYQTAAGTAARDAAVTGGYGNSGAIEQSLARQASNAASAATQGALGQVAGLQQSGEIAGTQALNTEQQNIAGNKLAATAGETNVYGLNEAQTTATMNQILQNYQQTGALNNQDLAVLTNLANQPGAFDKFVSSLEGLGGTAAGIIGAVNP